MNTTSRYCPTSPFAHHFYTPCSGVKAPSILNPSIRWTCVVGFMLRPANTAPDNNYRHRVGQGQSSPFAHHSYTSCSGVKAPRILNPSITWACVVGFTLRPANTAPDTKYKHRVRWAPQPVWAYCRTQNSCQSWVLFHAANNVQIQYTTQHSAQMTIRSVLTLRHRASSIWDRRFATPQRMVFIYLINKYISLSDICLTVHHSYK